MISTISVALRMAGLITCLVAGACRADMSPSDPSALIGPDAVGFWRVTGVAKGHDCLIALNRLKVQENFGVFVEACKIGDLASAVAWRPIQEGFELIFTNAASLRFRLITEDRYVSEDGRYRLERSAER
jgi:hypothetical protein